MLLLIKNELIKLNLRKKLLICTIILFAIGTLMIGGSALLKKFNSPENTIKILEKNVEFQKEELKKEGISEAEKNKIQNSIYQIELSIQNLKNESAMSKGDWKEPLKKIISTQEEELNNIPEDDRSMKETIYTNLITNKYCLEHNIRPIMGMDFSGFTLLDGFINTIGGLLLAIIAAIIAGDIVSSEYTPPTLKILLTKPVSRIKVLLSKYFAAIIGTLSIVLVIELFVFLIGGAIYGFGNAMAPKSMGTLFESFNNLVTGQSQIVPVFKSTYLVPAINFLVLQLFYQLLFIIATISFCFMLSTIFKTSSLSTALSFIIPIVFSIISVIPYVKKIAPLLYMNYGNPATVVNGYIAQNLGYSFITPLTSALILLLWIGITLTISIYNFKRKDLLI